MAPYAKKLAETGPKGLAKLLDMSIIKNPPGVKESRRKVLENMLRAIGKDPSGLKDLPKDYEEWKRQIPLKEQQEKERQAKIEEQIKSLGYTQ